MNMTDTVTHIHATVSEDDIENGASDLLKHLRPNWHPSDVRFKLLTDGITNKLVKCSHGESDEEVLLVRVYGRKTDLLIDRKAETRNIILLHNESLAPQLYATFDNGLVYEFAPGVTLTKDTIIMPHIFNLVAAKMAKLHLIRNGGDVYCKPMIWEKIEQFYNLVPEVFTDLSIQKKFKKINITKEKILREIKILKETLNKYNSPLVFCHNDLLLGNIIYNSGCNTVTFIDYEYAALNYQAFDIGNHFNEFAGVDDVDYRNYPIKVLQLAWLYQYLRVFWGRDSISSHELQDMYVKVNRFGLLSHILWGLWALIQAQHSTIDFDFIKFAAARLKRYFDTRDEFLNLGVNTDKECNSKNCQL